MTTDRASPRGDWLAHGDNRGQDPSVGQCRWRRPPLSWPVVPPRLDEAASPPACWLLISAVAARTGSTTRPHPAPHHCAITVASRAPRRPVAVATYCHPVGTDRRDVIAYSLWRWPRRRRRHGLCRRRG